MLGHSITRAAARRGNPLPCIFGFRSEHVERPSGKIALLPVICSAVRGQAAAVLAGAALFNCRPPARPTSIPNGSIFGPIDGRETSIALGAPKAR